MKQIRLTITLLALVIFAGYANAQTGAATFTKQGAITLSDEQPLQSAYTLDASTFNFKTEQEALTYFADKQSKYVSYRPVFQNNQIMVYLQIQAKPEWTKSDWNAYLAKNKIHPKANSQ